MKKVPVSLVNATFVCATFLSTLYLALCFDNDGEHRPLSSLNVKENHFLWPPVNDRVALKELYELYGDQLWKRAPASGFYGVRGKKVPGQNFFGMRGRRGPSGFMGVRGKKMNGIQEGVNFGGGDFDSEPLDAELNELWNSVKESQLHDNGKLGDNSLDDHMDNNKRAPSNGFMGMRGKRNTISQDAVNVPHNLH